MGQSTVCANCRSVTEFPVAFTMAFQPIVDVCGNHLWGHEALVRGSGGEGAASVLRHVDDTNRYAFDQACRVKAIELAGRHIGDRHGRLSINFMPNAVYEPRACIRLSLEAARESGFDPKRLMFEFTEDERIADAAHTKRIIDAYRRMGFLTAIDDFGAGFAGLSLLAEFQPDIIKLDMALVRGLDGNERRRTIVGALASLAAALEITVLAEGVETQGEMQALRDAGISLQQGYFFGRPALERFEVPAGFAAGEERGRIIPFVAATL
ncbi:EAL domain, c-di-GMP-specific phosphodiesterase class I (or its enzymatically inactive variant) [Devosia enhydra]|uniref:EAL domain, c-di-GMP-specific phosphodiesterase class I (Or its enzymatically inactive variant) n=1 Tax=Devosia enhydra TaxID=665118 RepID=A0A1K2HTS5_9HYPH|nr:EAL domain-containing protein [Devosia enhydra]SFZ81461.1 EAL domain, c-di-GMP-specific phosphodiesterase class I (or its enzymatically inactive variant) [Devosia enhydra]